MRQLTLNPMHDLFLGTAKKFFQFVEKRQHFESTQKEIDSCKVPAGIGRIPRKIAAGLSHFTADQWKSCVFSLASLMGKIPQKDYYMLVVFRKSLHHFLVKSSPSRRQCSC